MPNGFAKASASPSVEVRTRVVAPRHGYSFWLATIGFVVTATHLAFSPARAQQANPGYDPRQTEKRFEDPQQTGEAPAARPCLPRAPFARPEGKADTKPLFLLRHVVVSGAVAIPHDRIATAYQPYLGKKVSQADLIDIASAVGDVYRAAGFHLSRAIVPVQDIRDGAGSGFRVIEGSITEVTLKGEGAGQFGVQPMLDAVAMERPSRLATLERQLFLVNSRPGVRIQDTSLEEIGNASGRFRLTVELKTWHLYTSFGVDANLGSSGGRPVRAKLCHRGLELLSRAWRFPGAQSVDHAGRSAPTGVRPAVL